jgi:hypothetical protein
MLRLDSIQYGSGHPNGVIGLGWPGVDIPAIEPYKSKRVQIVEQLKKRKFEAFTSEELSESMPSELGVVEQEEIHMQNSDLVLVLDFSAGLGHEISSYAHSPDFINRTMVFYPSKWDPARTDTYPGHVIHQFYNRTPVSQDEVDRCDLIKVCVQRAEAFRANVVKMRELSED